MLFWRERGLRPSEELKTQAYRAAIIISAPRFRFDDKIGKAGTGATINTFLPLFHLWS